MIKISLSVETIFAQKAVMYYLEKLYKQKSVMKY